jgi:hypothetical protein
MMQLSSQLCYALCHARFVIALCARTMPLPAINMIASALSLCFMRCAVHL